jgi:hypothetical protein
VNGREHGELDLKPVDDDGDQAAKVTNRRPPAAERLATPGAYLDRQDLFALGFQRTAVDVICRACAPYHPPGVRRAYYLSDDVRAHLAEHTYDGRTKVRQ